MRQTTVANKAIVIGNHVCHFSPTVEKQLATKKVNTTPDDKIGTADNSRDPDRKLEGHTIVKANAHALT
jgi:hypothetical protein